MLKGIRFLPWGQKEPGGREWRALRGARCGALWGAGISAPTTQPDGREDCSRAAVDGKGRWLLAGSYSAVGSQFAKRGVGRIPSGLEPQWRGRSKNSSHGRAMFRAPISSCRDNLANGYKFLGPVPRPRC
jgi:hypothetical protein